MTILIIRKTKRNNNINTAYVDKTLHKRKEIDMIHVLIKTNNISDKCYWIGINK